MNPMRAPFLCIALAVLGAASLLADFRYEQTSKITGGAMMSVMKMAGAFSKSAREPMTSTVLVKGNRIVYLRPDSAEIIDVDKETVTSVNFQKKTYSVMTFAQMKQMMQDMSQRMRKSKDENSADVHYKLSTRDTGQTKTISGVRASEMIVTLTNGVAEITSDMWLAKVAGYEEVRNLQGVMAAKLGFVPGQGLGAIMQRPDMRKAFTELYKEAAKLDGMPVMMITRMGSQGSGQAAGTQQQQSPAGDSGLLLEMTTESSEFSTADVDAAKFEVPAGFKQVEPEMQRRGQ